MRTVQSNVKSIDGKYYTGTPKYVDSKSGNAIVLLENEQYVVFNDGIDVKNTFDIEIAMQNPRYNNIFLTLNRDKSLILFKLCKRRYKSIENALCVVMTGFESGNKCRYTIQSNVIDYNGEYLRISIKRENSVWAICLQKVDEAAEVAE